MLPIWARWQWSVTPHYPQNSSITVASPSCFLVSYPCHVLWVWGLTPLQKFSRCILQPPFSRLGCFCFKFYLSIHRIISSTFCFMFWNFILYQNTYYVFFNYLATHCDLEFILPLEHFWQKANPSFYHIW